MWLFGKKKNHETPIPSRASLEIRMDAIGGQGAHSLGKIIARAASLRCAYEANHYSSFGSEKRGTPVKSFVRVSTKGQPVRSATELENPDVILLFHESLLSSHPHLLEASSDSTDLIINSPRKPRDIEFPAKVKIRFVATLDASKIARQVGCNVNAVMLGAFCAFCPEIEMRLLKLELLDFYTGASEEVRQKNQKGFELGFEKIKDESFHENQIHHLKMSQDLPDLGWMNAPIGGVITNPGTSILKNHVASRKGVAPVFLRDLCFDCGYCDAVCPDFCFVWDLSNSQPKLQGIDYQYCKACEKCVAVCPASALVLKPENEIPDDKKVLKKWVEGSSHE